MIMTLILPKSYEDFCNRYPFNLTQQSITVPFTNAIKDFWINEVKNIPNTKVWSRLRGEDEDFQVCSNHVNNEYILDLLCEDTGTNSIKLALELEWEEHLWPEGNEAGQVHDFIKLVWTKSKYKVFIFQVNYKNG